MNATVQKFPSLIQPVKHYLTILAQMFFFCPLSLLCHFLIDCLLFIRKCCHFSACELNVLLVSWPGLLGQKGILEFDEQHLQTNKTESSNRVHDQSEYYLF